MDSYYIYRNDSAADRYTNEDQNNYSTDGYANEGSGYYSYPDAQWYQYRPTRRGGQNRRFKRREARLQAEAEAEAEAAYAQAETPLQQDSGVGRDLDPNASIFTPPKQQYPEAVDVTSGQPQQVPAAESEVGFLIDAKVLLGDVEANIKGIDLGLEKTEHTIARLKLCLEEVRASVEKIKLPKEVGVVQEVETAKAANVAEGVEVTEEVKVAKEVPAVEKVVLSAEEAYVEAKTPEISVASEEVPVQGDASVENEDDDGEQSLPTPARSQFRRSIKSVKYALAFSAAEGTQFIEVPPKGQAGPDSTVSTPKSPAYVEPAKSPLPVTFTANPSVLRILNPEEAPVVPVVAKATKKGGKTPVIEKSAVRAAKAPAVAVPIIPKTAGSKPVTKPAASQAKAPARPAAVRPAKETSPKLAARSLPAKPVRATSSGAVASKPTVPPSTRTRSLERATGPRATSRGRTAERDRPTAATRRASSPAARPSFVTRLAESLVRSSRTASPRPALRLRDAGIPSEPTIKEEAKTSAALPTVGGITAARARALDALKGPLSITTSEIGRGQPLRRRRTGGDAEQRPRLGWQSKGSQSAIEEKRAWT